MIIQPADYSAVDSVAYGAGITQATAGIVAYFTIQPRDIYGNNGTYNPLETFAVNIQNNLQPSLVLEDPRVVAPTQNSDTAVYTVGCDIAWQSFLRRWLNASDPLCYEKMKASEMAEACFI